MNWKIPKRKKVISMKLVLGEQYSTNVQDTTVTINIDAVATSDGGDVILLQRTLSYTVNTANAGWRDAAITNLKEQAVEFEADANQLLVIQNDIANISADVGK